MKTKTLLFFVTALLSVIGAKADVIPSSYYSEPAEGTFYLYNVTQDKFLCGTGDPSLVSAPTTQVILTALTGDDAGKYSIQAVGGKYYKMGYANNRYLWGNNWTDNGFFKWTFSADGTKTYNLSITATANADGKFTNGNTYYTNGESGVTETIGDANEWALITEESFTSFQSGVAGKKFTIIAAKGDATSLVTNPTFESEIASEWTGGARTAVGINTWRGNGNADYESTTDNVTFSQTLSNMPAGTYKVVAAVRGDNGTTATAKLNGTAGTTITNGAFDTSRQQINLNGVQMPFSNLGGFNMSRNALGWQWATATYTLESDGDLTIAFDMTGAKWKGIDDVHLYYMSDGTNTYAVEYSDGIDNTDHVVTCDLQTDNPNKMWVSKENIYTASGAIVNNNLLNNNWVNCLVLYDGYGFSAPRDFRPVESYFYRNISKGDADYAFATVAVPFLLKAQDNCTFYQPASLSDGTLYFETVDGSTVTFGQGKAYLLKVTANTTVLRGPHDGYAKASPVDNGSGVTMKGTFTNISNVPTNDYVLSGTNLYLVNSPVSLKPFRAYFTETSGGSVKANVIGLNFDYETGITEHFESIQNSECIMLNEAGAMFDLSGRRVSKAQKGLYILNGRKVLVK